MKKLVFKLVPALVSIVMISLWISSIVSDNGLFNFGHVAGAILISFGLAELIYGLITKNDIMMHKTRIILGSLYSVLGVVALIFAFTTPKNLILPIIMLAVAVVAVIAIIFSNGKGKWDKGDNEDPNYKTYFERQAEEKAKEEKGE